MATIQFVRDTYDYEDSDAHFEGDVLEVSDESALRWERRGAAERVDRGRAHALRDDDASEYSRYTVPQLRAELESRGIGYREQARKAELIEELEASDASDD